MALKMQEGILLSEDSGGGEGAAAYSLRQVSKLRIIYVGKCARCQRGSGEAESPRKKSSDIADESTTALMIYETVLNLVFLVTR